MKEEDMKKVVEWIDKAVRNKDNEDTLEEIKREVESFCVKFPIPGVEN
jgi:glycine hydroxymethyltransferase